MKEAHGSRRQDDLQPAPEFAQLTQSPDASSRQRQWDGVVVDLHKVRSSETKMQLAGCSRISATNRLRLIFHGDGSRAGALCG
jgi:hypothetical protein